MANNHITVGVYNNKEYKYNIVRDEDLVEQILPFVCKLVNNYTSFDFVCFGNFI